MDPGPEEPTRQDGEQPDESTEPLAENAPDKKPIHKMFFDPNMDTEEIADIIWENRDKGAWGARARDAAKLKDDEDD